MEEGSYSEFIRMDIIQQAIQCLLILVQIPIHHALQEGILVGDGQVEYMLF